MEKHLHKEIEKLKKKMLTLSAIAEERTTLAVKSLKEKDAKLAREVINRDFEIDEIEVELEEDCLKILALHQPVAIDLRFIVAALKINSELERIGDLAVNIAERAEVLASQINLDIPPELSQMTQKAEEMLRNSLDALINMDADLAYQVCEADDEVDALNRDMYRLVEDKIEIYPDQIENLIHLLQTSRHLERIADHATNIAEDVVYMIQGDIIRHHAEDYRLLSEKEKSD